MSGQLVPRFGLRGLLQRGEAEEQRFLGHVIVPFRGELADTFRTPQDRAQPPPKTAQKKLLSNVAAGR
jgi:hypothetical protein